MNNNRADVELVIKIDEKLYKDIYSDAEIMIYGGMRSGKTLLVTLLRVIRNGTPLPKGHGRLIDADAYSTAWFNSRQFEPMLLLDFAPTIIEADKSESEE